jgi:hypothetical protein
MVVFSFGQANFARAVASLSKAQAKKVTRFLPNPESHWGPKLRAGRQITSKHISLLGPQALNGTVNHENGEEPTAKRQKTEEPTPNSWIWVHFWEYVYEQACLVLCQLSHFFFFLFFFKILFAFSVSPFLSPFKMCPRTPACVWGIGKGQRERAREIRFYPKKWWTVKYN